MNNILIRTASSMADAFLIGKLGIKIWQTYFSLTSLYLYFSRAVAYQEVIYENL